MSSLIPNWNRDGLASVRKIDRFEIYKQIAHGGSGTIHVGIIAEIAGKIRNGTLDVGMLDGTATEEQCSQKKASYTPDSLKRYGLVAIKVYFCSSDGRRAFEAEREFYQSLTLNLKSVLKDDSSDAKISANFPALLGSAKDPIKVKHFIGGKEVVDERMWTAIEVIHGISLRTLHLCFSRQGEEDGMIEIADSVLRPGKLGQLPRHYLIPIPVIYHIFLELATSLKYMHEILGWAHSDIKKDNVMIREQRADPHGGYPDIVLIDFGTAKKLSDNPKMGFEIGPSAFKHARQKDAKDLADMIVDLSKDHSRCGNHDECILHKTEVECRDHSTLFIQDCGHHDDGWEKFFNQMAFYRGHDDASISAFLDEFEQLADEKRISSNSRDHNFDCILEAATNVDIKRHGIANNEIGHAISKAGLSRQSDWVNQS